MDENKGWKALIKGDNILKSMFWLTMITVGGGLLFYVTFGLILGVIRGVPDDGADLVKESKRMPVYAARLESQRVFKYGEDEIASARVNRLSVDERSAKFQLDLIGYDTQGIRILGDKNATVRQGDGEFVGLQKINPEAFKVPQAADWAKFKPTIVSDSDIVVGERAFLVDFKPTCAYIGKYVLLGGGISSIHPVTNKDANLLVKNKCKVEFAQALITRKRLETRLVDMKFVVDGTTTYRYLIKLEPLPDDQMKDFELVKEKF